MNKEKPFFSIITASYNSENTLERTIESVLNLDFNDKTFEYIIIDGNSKDKTVAIIESFIPKFQQKNISFSYISEPDKGIYDAWNKGVQKAKGEWISFLGSDDDYFKNALKLYYNQIQMSDSINYISSIVNVTNKKGKIISFFGEKYNFKKIITDFNIAQVGSFHKKELFDKVGLFDTTYSIVGDLDFYIRCKDYIKPAYFDSVTANMENGGVSNQVYKALKEALQVKLKYGYTSKMYVYYKFYSSLLKCYVKIALNKK